MIIIRDIEEIYSAELKSIFENAVSIPRICSIHCISTESSGTITSTHSVLPFSRPVKISNKRKEGHSWKSCPTKVEVIKGPEKKKKSKHTKLIKKAVSDEPVLYKDDLSGMWIAVKYIQGEKILWGVHGQMSFHAFWSEYSSTI